MIRGTRRAHMPRRNARNCALDPATAPSSSSCRTDLRAAEVLLDDGSFTHMHTHVRLCVYKRVIRRFQLACSSLCTCLAARKYPARPAQRTRVNGCDGSEDGNEDGGVISGGGGNRVVTVVVTVVKKMWVKGVAEGVVARSHCWCELHPSTTLVLL